ncbi:beta-N-acetylhexosaminidase [Marivirga sp. S37H4]|uniref:beta-N-acetylhexosaminidase n=1 Tax=Marivirga aurantiaca TaxID=2802615 RepID=A0A935C9S4_9BACT|nr:beta-N-acetylhexosaminidase [Marivirga aurantiaca]MBK6266200.1 beta-N-acetylhexosaminidase [Marivirga aurantiaca]
MKHILLIFFVLVPLLGYTQSTVSIIPFPNQLVTEDGFFSINAQTEIVADEGLEFEVKYLQSIIDNHFRIKPTVAKKLGENVILLQLSQSDMAEEAYELHITAEQISITASESTGVFYGLQSLRQILASIEENRIPAMKINDSPRFDWRGMHLDCSRHFFNPEEVKKYLDYMALYKMNTFHWHLTEDQGWRIEIKAFPKLTEIGAWRTGTMVGKYDNHEYDSIRYGGFYTQEEIKEIVAYAKERHITVVPEIEMPGHSLAALAAYPELSCTGGPFQVARKWGVFEDVYCAGNDSVFVFLETVMDEVLILFPSQYIHIGGDESPKKRWEACAKCQNRIKEEGLKDEHELQSYFIQRMEQYLNAKGRKIIGWDEILEGGLAPNAAVMSWRGTEGGIAAAREAHSVVMSPGSPCYFDHYQVKDPTNEPLAIGGYNPLDKVYAYEPIPESLSPTEGDYIMGAQGNVWTEYMKSFDHVEYMALPRMSALSEVLWTQPEFKNYKDFLHRLKYNTQILDEMGANYSKHFLSDIK